MAHDGAPIGNQNAAGPHKMSGTSIKSADKISSTGMGGRKITIASLKSSADKNASPQEKDRVIQDAMDLAFDNPENYYDVKDALRASGLDKQFEWEMGPANTNAMSDVIKPAIEKAKNELKSKIPSPSKNKSSSCTINGQKIEFFNARNAMYPNASRSRRFIDISISDPETGERIGSYAAKDYESAMEHVYRIAGLNTGR